MLGTGTSGSDGTFRVSYSTPPTGVIYLVATGGSNGSNSANSNIQLLTILGTSSALPSGQTSFAVNEQTSAASMALAADFGILIDSSGSVTIKSPVNANALSNFNTQYGNLFLNGSLNTSNPNLSTAMKNSFNTMANAFAACVESSGQCSTLMSTAKSSSSINAANMLEAGYNMVTNQVSASSIFNFGNSFASTTGFSVSSTPSLLGSPLPATAQTFAVPGVSTLEGVTTDTSGNMWLGAGNGVDKLSSNGVFVSTTSTGANSISVAADASGNIWATGGNSLKEINSAGSVIQTVALSSANGLGIAFDPNGNLWVAHENGSGTVDKITPSGTILGTFSTGGSSTSVAIDSLGNAYVLNLGDNTITALNSAGTLISTYSLGTCTTPINNLIDVSRNLWVGCLGNAQLVKLSTSGSLLQTVTGVGVYTITADSAGNIFAENLSNGNVTVVNSSGQKVAVYPFPNSTSSSDGLAVDASGNVWVTDLTNTQVVKWNGIATGPEPVPFSIGLPAMGNHF